MLRVWNVTLVITTFLLTIFGTFMTRSGVVQSVHAFGEDKELAAMFTTFMVAVTAFARPDDRRTALDAGFTAYLAKPIDGRQLASLLRDMVPAA